MVFSGTLLQISHSGPTYTTVIDTSLAGTDTTTGLYLFNNRLFLIPVHLGLCLFVAVCEVGSAMTADVVLRNSRYLGGVDC